jgi:hypothetical protein
MAVGYIRESYCIIHDGIGKSGASLPVNYLPYVKLCIDIPEDGLSIDQNMYYACTGKGIK